MTCSFETPWAAFKASCSKMVSTTAIQIHAAPAQKALVFVDPEGNAAVTSDCTVAVDDAFVRHTWSPLENAELEPGRADFAASGGS